jgi:hypothetical protein
MKDYTEVMKKLQAPFTPDEIEWRVGSTNKDKTKGLALAYVTNRAIQNRLDDVFGCFNWSNQFKEWKGTSQICGISVYDEDKSQWVTKWDGADDSQTEAVKGGLSDSMKRAAYQWGIGRYLYNLPQTWVNLKDGRYLAETPKLPQWALPEGYKEEKTENRSMNTENNTMPVDLKSENASSKKGGISEKQVNRAIAIAKSKGITLEQIKKGIVRDYNKTEIADLTKSEYDELCSKLEAINKGA